MSYKSGSHFQVFNDWLSMIGCQWRCKASAHNQAGKSFTPMRFPAWQVRNNYHSGTELHTPGKDQAMSRQGPGEVRHWSNGKWPAKAQAAATKAATAAVAVAAAQAAQAAAAADNTLEVATSLSCLHVGAEELNTQVA